MSNIMYNCIINSEIHTSFEIKHSGDFIMSVYNTTTYSEIYELHGGCGAVGDELEDVVHALLGQRVELQL